jgi:hypothetical protein
MEIERKEQHLFEPIIITIETQKEFDFLWHLLNNPVYEKFYDYLDEHNNVFTEFEATNLKTDIWQLLNRFKKDDC